MSEGKQEKGGQGKGRDSQGGQEGRGKKGQSGSDEDRDDDHGKSGQGDKGRHGPSSQSPSMIRTILIPAVVALVCGVVGAWGYSHFFGSDKSGDQSSGGDSGSSKGGGDSGSSKGGGDSGSGKGGSGSGSGKSSETRKNSTSNDKNSSKLVEAEEAWLAAVKELRQAKESEKAARSAEEEKKAILDYFKNTLLSAGRPGDASLSEAFWAGGQGKDVTLRKALDLADSRVADAFAERPLVEAGVREMLGLGYLNVGEPERAVQEYERALALREATQGPNHPDAAACRNQLAVAYRIAGRTTEAARLFDRNPNTPAHAAALAVRGMMLLLQKSPADAELKLREALTIRRKIQPDDWATFDTMSVLGEALMAQKKYAEAEPLLLSGYEGLRQRQDAIPPQDRPRIAKALERLVAFYEAKGDQDKASRWRQELEATTDTKKA